MKSMTLTLLSTPLSRKLFCPFERTPLAEKPPPLLSRAPGSAGRTPGDKRAKYANTREPPSGRSAMAAEVRLAPSVVLSVCSSGASAETTTDSVRSPTRGQVERPFSLQELQGRSSGRPGGPNRFRSHGVYPWWESRPGIIAAGAGLYLLAHSGRIFGNVDVRAWHHRTRWVGDRAGDCAKVPLGQGRAYEQYDDYETNPQSKNRLHSSHLFFSRTFLQLQQIKCTKKRLGCSLAPPVF